MYKLSLNFSEKGHLKEEGGLLSLEGKMLKMLHTLSSDDDHIHNFIIALLLPCTMHES